MRHRAAASLRRAVTDRAVIGLPIGELGDLRVAGLNAATVHDKRLVQLATLFKHFAVMNARAAA